MSRGGPRTGLRYGVDGYPYLLGLSGAAGALGVAGGVALPRAHGRGRVAAVVALVAAGAAAVPAGLGTRYVVSGKLRLRDRLLDRVHWRGDETVVDLGAGAGLLALGAARRTTGTVHAVDLFIGKDLSGNSPERLQRNARREGVQDRLVLHRDDVRALPLPDASVDVVLSALCLHNIGDAPGRAQALHEAVRVLRPGGTLALSDLAHVDDEYAPLLRAAGLVVRTHGRGPGTFPVQRSLTARVPSGV